MGKHHNSRRQKPLGWIKRTPSGFAGDPLITEACRSLEKKNEHAFIFGMDRNKTPSSPIHPTPPAQPPPPSPRFVPSAGSPSHPSLPPPSLRRFVPPAGALRPAVQSAGGHDVRRLLAGGDHHARADIAATLGSPHTLISRIGPFARPPFLGGLPPSPFTVS